MEKREAYCHLVASVLASDGIIEPSERRFLHDAMTKMALTPHERDQVMHFENNEEALTFASKFPESERRELLDELVAAALVDGRLSPYETALIEKISVALSLSA